MTGHLAWGITFAVFCVIGGMLIAGPIGYAHGRKRAAEDAEDARSAAVIDEWRGLPDEDAPSPPWPAAPPQAPRAGPGRHRNPAGPARHAGLPAAGYLPAAPWDGMTLTMPAPAQSPPWDQPDRMLHVQGILRAGDAARTTDTPEPEPPAQVLEPTAADCHRPDALTDTGWTRLEARRLVEEMDRDIARITADGFGWIAERIGATDSTLKAITK